MFVSTVKRLFYSGILQMEMCPNIKFHFIGHLQKNKVPKLLSAIDKLFVIETIDSEALAKTVNDRLAKQNVTNPLNVMVQVNTSGEDCTQIIVLLTFKQTLFKITFHLHK